MEFTMMKNVLKKYACLLWLVAGFGLLGSQSYAQRINVTKIDTAAFPELKVELQLVGADKAVKDDFKVLDEKNPTEPISFNLTAPEKKDSIAKKKNRAILFLVDASAVMNGNPIASVKRALTNSLGVLTPDDKIQIAYFSDSDQLSYLSPDFTNNFAYFIDEIRNKIATQQDTSNTPVSKVHASIYHALEVLDETELEGQKILMVLSAGKNKGSSFSSTECIKRANHFKIPVYSVTYQLDNKPPDDLSRISTTVEFEGIPKGERSRIVKTSSEIQRAISDFFSIREEIIENQGINVMLTFDTEAAADGNEHSFEIRYKNESKRVTYFSPLRPNTGGNFFRKYGIFIIIAAGALLGILVWFVHSRNVRRAEEERIAAEEEAEAAEQARIAAEAAQRQKQEAMIRKQQEEAAKQSAATDQRLKSLEEQNIRLQEQVRAQQLNAQNHQPTPIDPKFDMKRTVISGGGGAPTLMVSAGSFSHSFSLNKPKMFIGRSEDNDITIPTQTVSGQHATITIEKGSFYLTDLGSTNGTFVNGSRVSRTILKSGDMIKLGAANLKFHI
ncbi:FHA domain-containing protein [uncultured Microscilla sp.]|uniref:FHA domain-containing protein n=1 Tax=uncultured Microscilla sp. TaxID=432653 RepID=UPI00260568B1|nr:FHA domain-containing protein [uncultured Microscilla sp.]